MKRLSKIRRRKLVARRMTAALLLGTMIPVANQQITPKGENSNLPARITFTLGYLAPSTHAIYQFDGFTIRIVHTTDVVPGRAGAA